MTSVEKLIRLVRDETKDEPIKYVDTVYHGTRCPTEILRTKGLVYDKDFLVNFARRIARDLNIDFDQWIKSGRNQTLSGHSVYTSMIGTEYNEYRARIWVTANFENAKSYARRNPEIIYDVVISMMMFKFPRRDGDKFFDEIHQLQKRFLGLIGKPKVVVIDARKIGLKVTESHCNCPLNDSPLGDVPVEAIKEIIMVE